MLHDASSAGLATAGRVREWFDGTGAGAPASVRVVAVGIRPVHARALSLSRARAHGVLPEMRLTGPQPTDPSSTELASPGLLPWEVRWLARGRTSARAAVAPDRRLRGVHRALRGQPRGRWAPPA
nr:hypothetical protein [Micromonospora sp. DSM 115978]